MSHFDPSDFVSDSGPMPVDMTQEEEISYLRKSSAKLFKKVGELGGVHAHMLRVLDAAGIHPGHKIHRRVELACLELQQLRLQVKFLQVSRMTDEGDDLPG